MGLIYGKEKQKYGIPHRQLNYQDCDNVETQDIQVEGVKARVDRVHVNGLMRTKNDIIEDAVQDLFTAYNFQEVLLKSHSVLNKLNSLGCFRNIGIFIDTSKGKGATPNGLEITFYVKELKRVVGGVNTQVGENEGSLVIGLRAPNLFGRGERIQTEYSYGSKKSNNFNITFVKPLKGKHNPMLSASVYQATSEWPTSGYKELTKGILCDFGFHSLPLIKHNIQWDMAIRDLSVLSRSSSFEVREESGFTLKSALKHILSIDLRDDTIFPSCGSLFQFTTEYAGIGGNVGFFKNDAFAQTNYSILDDFVFQASATGGILYALGNDWRVGMSDMYYLGGPLSLRGFQMRGIGPRSDGGNALGSTWFWSGGLHLYSPLPFRPGKNGFGELFRTHVFLNAGNIGNLEGDLEELKEKLIGNVRIAYGAGIAFRLGHLARVEINYCFPHSFQENDATQPGVQFGIGVQFL